MPIHTAYIIELSTKATIQVDPDELPLIIQSMKQGTPVLLRHGLVNPSYIVAVREDTDRRKRFLEETKYPQDAARRESGMTPLKSIFGDPSMLLGSAKPAQLLR